MSVKHKCTQRLDVQFWDVVHIKMWRAFFELDTDVSSFRILKFSIPNARKQNVCTHKHEECLHIHGFRMSQIDFKVLSDVLWLNLPVITTSYNHQGWIFQSSCTATVNDKL